MKPRSLLAGITLLAFLTIQGICPVPSFALRVQNAGMEESSQRPLLERRLRSESPLTGLEEDGSKRGNLPEFLQGMDSGRLEHLLKNLSSWEREIIRMRYGFNPEGVIHTLEGIGLAFRISKERTRQIQDRALRKMKHRIEIEKEKEPVPPAEDPRLNLSISELLEQPLVQKHFNKKTLSQLLNRLDWEGIYTAGELTQKTSVDLLKLEGFGDFFLVAIEFALGQQGLALAVPQPVVLWASEGPQLSRKARATLRRLGIKTDEELQASLAERLPELPAVGIGTLDSIKQYLDGKGLLKGEPMPEGPTAAAPAAGLEEKIEQGLVRVLAQWSLPLRNPKRSFIADTMQEMEMESEAAGETEGFVLDADGKYTAGASGVIFHEGAQYFYILSASHVTNPLQLPRDFLNPSVKLVLSDGTQIPAEIVGDSHITKPDLSIIKVSKKKIPTNAIAVIPLAPGGLVDEFIEQRKTAVLLGYPIGRDRERWEGRVTDRYEGSRFGKRRIGEDGLRIFPEVPGGFSGGPVIYQGHLVGLVAGYGTGTPAISGRTIRQFLREVSEGTLPKDEFENFADRTDKKELKKLLQTSGLEEQGVSEAMAVLDEAAPQGDGILVLEAGVLGRAGLEEFVGRVGSQLGRRFVLFGKESAAAKEAAARSGILLVDSDDPADLAFRLAGMEERVGRIGYVGNRRTAELLARILPPSMPVTPLDPSVTLPDLFLFLGYPVSFLDQINASGLEEGLARSRAA